MIEFPTGENIQAADKIDPEELIKGINECAKIFEDNYIPKPHYIVYTKAMYEAMIKYYEDQDNAEDLPTWEEFKKRDYVDVLDPELYGDSVMVNYDEKL